MLCITITTGGTYPRPPRHRPHAADANPAESRDFRGATYCTLGSYKTSATCDVSHTDRVTATPYRHVAHIGLRWASSVTKSSEARNIVCGYLSSRVPQWLLEPLHRTPAHSPHCGECTGHLFASQLQQTAENRYPQVYARAGLASDVRRRTRWVTSLGSRARPHDSGSGPRMPRKSSASRARPTLLEHPSVCSTVTVGDE